jgi:hypothetical protein
VLAHEAADIVAFCPEHGDRDTAWIACHCDVADDMERRAAVLRRLSGETAATCPGYETVPNRCACPCEGCKHNCAAHQPGETANNTPETRGEFTSDDRDSYHRWLKEAETARDEARLHLSRVIGERDRLAREAEDLLHQEADLIVAHCPKHGPKDQTGFWLDCHCAVADDMRRRAEAAAGVRQDGAQQT